MRIEHEGLTLWYGTDDAPAPAGEIPNPGEQTITAGVQPVDASNSVEVRYRTNGGPVETVPARWLRNDPSGNAQYFHAQLPLFREGDRVEYSVVCRCAGRQVPSDEEAARLTTSFRVVDADSGLSPDTSRLAEPASAERGPGLTEEPLTNATTDSGDSYTKRYDTARLRRTEERNTNLITRGYGADVEPQPSDVAEMVYHGPADARFDIIASVRPELSEYDQIMSTLLPFLGNRELAGFSEEEVVSLADRSGVERSRLSEIVKSEKLGQETNVPSEIFYGLAQRDLPLELDSLLARERKTLRTALEDVIERKIIAAPLEADIEVFLQQLERLRSRRAPLKQLASTLGWDGEVPLLDHLAGRGIRNLEDIRKAGGISLLEDFPVPADDYTVRLLEAHARLSVLPTDLIVNAQLVALGYESLDDVAETPPDTFIETVKDRIDVDKASMIHAAASTQSRYLGNVLTGLRLRAPYGVPRELSVALSKALPNICGCPHCRDATSQMAYLADLLDYAIRHLKHDGTAINLTFLKNRFHQPFGDLPVKCELMEKRVRQIRIAIEVLRGYLPAQSRNYTSQGYLELAYLNLLRKIGTSFDELREVRAWPDDRMRMFFDRHGLFLDPNEPAADLLQMLLRDPTDPMSLTEDYLEGVFGLRDTRRPPLDPDEEEPAYLGLRLMYLRHVQWPGEDWPANPPSGAPPLIDPDVIWPEDMVFSTLTPANQLGTRAPTLPVHFWEDRHNKVTDWLKQMAEVHEVLNDPKQEIEAFITDRAYSNLNNIWVQLYLGLGISLDDFRSLHSDRLNGVDISTKLEALNLTEAAFDQLASVWEAANQNPPGKILAFEWDAVDAILVQRLKQRQFATWRAEEQARGFALTPEYFRLRSSTLAGGTEWRPRAWRATYAVRRQWVDLLRARIEQEEAVRTALEKFVQDVEELLLHHVRNELIIPLIMGSKGSVNAGWLTQHLHIDFEAGVCQMTTRIAQAIETIQGMLFGARHGLLEDDITLEAPYFDDEWQWIGSYASWRAAMQVFLYPENALRPTLRLEKSKAFNKLIATLRAAIPVKPGDAQQAADEYAKYFNDICTLTPVAGYQTGNWSVAAQEADYLNRPSMVVGRGGSGKLYFAAFDALPEWYQTPMPGHTMWEEIEGLPANCEVKGFLPHQTEPGKVHLGLYAHHKQNASESLYFANFDGSRWEVKPIAGLPALICSAEYRGGIIPPAERLRAVGINGWRVSGDDRLVSLYVEGGGSRNRLGILVIAGEQEMDGTRRVGILRGHEGGLILSAFTRIDSSWDLPASGPHLLWNGGVQRLLLIKNERTAVQLGLLGTTWPPGSDLEMLWQTADGYVYASNGVDRWKVRSELPIVTADIDGDGLTEVITVEYEATQDKYNWSDTSTRLTILRASGAGLELYRWQYLDHPHANFPGSCKSGIHIRGEQFVPVGWGTQKNLIFLARDERTVVRQGDCITPVHPSIFAWETRWSNQRLNTHAIVKLELDGNETFFAVDLPNGNQGVLLLSPSRHDVLALTRQQSTQLAETWKTTAGGIDPVTPITTGTWSYKPEDRFILLGPGPILRDLLVLRSDGSEVAALDIDGVGKLAVRWKMSSQIQTPSGTNERGWRLNKDARYIGIDLDSDGSQEIVTLTPDGRLGVLRNISLTQDTFLKASLGPVSVSVRDIVGQNSRRWLADRQARIKTAYDSNTAPSLMRYLDEAFYFVPMEIGHRLRESGYFTEALDWFRSVYDYTSPIPNRKIAYKLVLDEISNGGDSANSEGRLERYAEWLRDPLNPHAIAETRKHTYTRFTIHIIARCLIDYADAEFTRATSESVPGARKLYLEALNLLNLPGFKEHENGCHDQIKELQFEIGEDEYMWIWQEARRGMAEIHDAAVLSTVIQRIEAILSSEKTLHARLTAVQDIVAKALETSAEPPSFEATLKQNTVARRLAQTALLSAPDTEREVERLGNVTLNTLIGRSNDHVIVGRDRLSRHSGYWSHVPAPSIPFCIPPNRAIQATRSHAELNLHKIRSCRNIAGMEMQLEPYAVPTAADIGLQSLGNGDRLPSFKRPKLQPLPYRYATLIERTKQLLQLAQQIENSMLASLQSLDQTEYELLKARQDLALAQAGVRLKDLQLGEATDNVSLAEMQRDQAQLQTDHYGRLLSQGLSNTEQAGLDALFVVHGLQEAGIVSPETLWEWAGAFAPAAQTIAEIITTTANYERRAQEWRFRKQLSEEEVLIGQQQVRLAQHRVRISAQDRAIAALQVAHAEEMINFIDTKKFGNAALYEWMASVLEQVYRYFLQQATSMAQLAEAQLAFERQEIPPAFIQTDYWEPASTTTSFTSGTPHTVSVRGLTGSARLLRDIMQLDQYAFLTDQRKLQLTRTISLAQLDPFAFHRFRETGVLLFATPMELFDRDFPGHYLRLIKRVRTSVIALIPPTHGIRATLSTTGTSRVVIGGDIFDTVVVQRGPESVALTAPINATGLFELDTQPEMLVPFEGIGVDSTWEFRLPRAANPFGYSTIADVLITIEYTALDSHDYRQQVIQHLDRRISADRAFSFRHEFADAWYDLHNPDLTSSPMTVSFITTREDFPPNLEGDLQISHVVLYFVPANGNPSKKIERVRLSLNEHDYGYADTDNEGIISTRRGAWLGLIGSMPQRCFWRLSLPNTGTMKQRFADKEDIADILLVITYTGQLPAWPS